MALPNERVLKQLLDGAAMEAVLDRVAQEIASRPPAAELVLVGMATRGIPLADKLADRLERLRGTPVRRGSIDPTFFRDDFHYRMRFKNPVLRAQLPVAIDGAEVVLVDDVLYTGRSVRAALDALMELGRPAAVRLCVMVDRGCRELPIAPDWCGLRVETRPGQEVRVRLRPHDAEDLVNLVEVTPS